VDTASGEHAAQRRKMRVNELKSEPLPEAWRNLPPVEYVRSNQAPDAWFLPEIKGTLHLSAHTQHPVTVDVLVNLTPTERLSGSNRSQDRNLSLLLPALKLFIAADWGDTPLRVSFLDLANRKVAFDQQKVRLLDWEGAKGSLAEIAPGIIDVKSLENRKFAANFFVKEVGQRIAKGANDPQRVVVVLSSPVAFESGVERHLIEAEPSSDVHVYYVRYHPYTNSLAMASPMRPPMGRRDPFGDVVFRPAPAGSQDDQLAGLLKPVRPELFDVNNPEQFRKALAAILEDIGRL
jgi:hypothetical protein